jgi:hypothetical protein
VCAYSHTPYIQRPHTAIYVPAYYYVSSGLILLSMCPHTTAVVAAVAACQPLVLLCMLIYVSAYYCSSGSRSSGDYQSWLILLYLYVCVCPHTAICIYFFHKKKQEPENWEPINHSCDPNTWLVGLNTYARYSVYLLYWYKSANTD